MQRRLGSLGLILVLCGSLAACGSSGSKSATKAVASSGSPNAARLLGARLAAAKCLRTQGIDVPDPTAQKGTAIRTLSVIASYPKVKIDAAEHACAPQLRQAFPNVATMTPSEIARRLHEFEVFATCMRSHGISSYPDPTSYATDPAGLVKAIAGVNQDSPAYRAAAPGCQKQALKDAGG